MNSTTAARWCLVAVTLAAGAGCQPREYQDHDPVVLSLIPGKSTLAARTNEAAAPLVFVAPADGRVFFFANEEMPASLVVKKGQRVALNEWDGADPPLSEVSIDGEVAYTNASRASMNRFYFAEEGL